MPSADPTSRASGRSRIRPELVAARRAMVNAQLASRGIRDPAVLDAMGAVPREAFLSELMAHRAYDDGPLPIGEGQTISQPYVVAFMIQAVTPRATDRALEIGTGSGYSAAVLGSIVADVHTIERLPALADGATRRLADLGYRNVHVRCGDGTLGWPEHAPYDVIVVTAGGPRVPPALLEQLAAGGRLVMPVGNAPRLQQLVRVRRRADGTVVEDELEAVAFVPLIGAQGWPEPATRERPAPRGAPDDRPDAGRG